MSDEEKVTKWIYFPIKSHFLVAFLSVHLKKLKVKGTHVQVLSHERHYESCVSLAAEAAVWLTLFFSFLCNPHHSHPNSSKSQPPIYFLPDWSYETAYILPDYSHHIPILLRSRVFEEQIWKRRPRQQRMCGLNQRQAALQRFNNGPLSLKNWIHAFLILWCSQHFGNYV